jgi:hypothetical protein
MTTRRRLFRAGAAGALAAAGLLPAPARAWENCVPRFVPGRGPVPACDVGIDLNRLAAAEDPQYASQWCWAASVSNIFDLHGFDLPQEAIVRSVYGTTVDLPARDTATISRLLSRAWVDARGRRFRSRIEGLYDATAGIARLDNGRIVAALRAGLPLLVCNRSHAMVLTAASYVADGPVPTILNLGFFDPWPGRGLRGPDRPGEILAAELGGELTYLALPSVARL